MPELCAFDGIEVYLYFLDNKQHKAPHFHAFHGDDEAVFRIPDGALLEGSLPRRKMKAVLKWVTRRAPELAQRWELAVAGEPFERIAPLSREEK